MTVFELLKSCDERETIVSVIKDLGSELEIEQTVGGTKGTDYMYVYENGSLINIKYLGCSRLISKEKWGRARTLEIYRLPKSKLLGKAIFVFSFTNSGYLHLNICQIDNVIKCYYCPLSSKETYIRLANMFKPIGGERYFLKVYLEFVPKFVKEIKNVMKRSGATEIFFASHAKRIEEVFEDPYLSILSTMVIHTWQGRLLSLQKKLSSIAELWVLAKIIEAIDGETITEEGKKGNMWWVEFTTNRPFAYIRSRITNKTYTIYYQPTIYPHIISGFLPHTPKLHLIPDIVIFEGIITQYIEWGHLHELIEQGKRPKLVVEVKTGLETTEWGKPGYVLNQLISYRKYLNPENIILAVIMQLKNYIKSKIRSQNIEIIDNLLSTMNMKKFKEYVLDALA